MSQQQNNYNLDRQTTQGKHKM